MGKPYLILPNFLGEPLRQRLLAYALAAESSFVNTQVGDGRTSRQDGTVRMSKMLDDFGDLQARFDQQVLAQVPAFIQALGLPGFAPSAIQSEIIAHNDGDFFKCHIDSFYGAHRSPAGYVRLITLVYYFYREPRAFSGGELCLYPLPAGAGNQVAGDNGVSVSIAQDMAIVFSSMLPHEVRKVSCGSGLFADSRFSINSWVMQSR